MGQTPLSNLTSKQESAPCKVTRRFLAQKRQDFVVGEDRQADDIIAFCAVYQSVFF
jgi:hypothetical protein